MKPKTHSTAARRRTVSTPKWHLLPGIKKLARNPAWEALEERITTHTTRKLPKSEK